MHVSRIPRLLIPAVIAIAMVACTKSARDSQSNPPSASAPGQTAVLLCQPGFHLCTSCRGTPICTVGPCPLCPPPASETDPGDEAAPELATPAETAALTCRPPLRHCTGCGGQDLCAIRCPECPPPEAPATSEAPSDVAATTSRPGQRLCPSCNGGPGFCATRCPECAPPEAPTATATPSKVAAITCHLPFHACPGCNGGPDYCGQRCFNCPVLDASATQPASETLALIPSVNSCGGRICSPGTFCCNPSCGICTPKGVNCTQQSCD